MSNNKLVLMENDFVICEKVNYKKRSKVTYRSKDSKYTFNTYRFDNVEVNNPVYMNWENLNNCGGWKGDDNYLQNAVQNGKKLLAVHIKLPDDTMSFDEFREYLGNINDSVYSGITTNSFGYTYGYVCKKGCMNDYINLEDVLAMYEKFGLIFPEKFINEIKEYMQTEMVDFVWQDENKFKYDLANPKNLVEIVFGGMLLGYPIESTVAVLNCEVK